MSFFASIATCFRKYATFAGRATRPEFWFFILFYVLVAVLATIADDALFGMTSLGEGSGPIATVFSLAVLLPTLAVTCRRLHDTGRSGWWQAPFYISGLLFMLIAFVIVASFGIEEVDLDAQDMEKLGLVLYAVFGAWALSFFAMPISFVMLLVFCCKPSQEGSNRYGDTIPDDTPNTPDNPDTPDA